MSPDQQIERSMLDGKDREQLHTIAGAVGVKGATRMRKADLIEAILATSNAANGGGDSGSGESGSASEAKPRRVRSARASELVDDSLAALAEEENALGGFDDPADVLPAPRPVRTPRAATPTTPVRTAPAESTEAEAAPEASNGASADHDSYASSGGNAAADADETGFGSGVGTDTFDPEDDRQPFGDGNRRGRRRRRGRGGQEPMGVGEPREREFQGDPIAVEGLLDLRDEGYGFLRAGGYLPGPKDVYISASQVRRFALRKGDYVRGSSRPQASNEKYPALLRVDDINGMTPEEARDRPKFEDLTPLFPDSRLRLELPDEPHEITGRIVDLISPIGKGQRGLIVSPPKAGKTTILKQLVYAIERNNPEVHLMVLLVDERPEEVTDMRRHVLRGEVVASTFDRPSDEHTHVAELTIERAKRLVEMGTDVVIVLDGITRAGAGVQPGGADIGSDHVGWCRLHGAVPAEAVLRRRPQHRRGRLAHDRRHCADRDRQPDGRSDLRGVQGHREHGAAPRPSPVGAPDLSRRSTSKARARATRSCCSTASSSSRSGSCGGC